MVSKIKSEQGSVYAPLGHLSMVATSVKMGSFENSDAIGAKVCFANFLKLGQCCRVKVKHIWRFTFRCPQNVARCAAVIR